MIEEPLPLLDDDDADPTVRRLLGSARGDGPSAAALRAAPAAIATLLVSHGGLAAGAAATATGGLAAAGTGSTTASVMALGKWFGIGALVGTVSVATITATTSTSTPERPAPRAAARSPQAAPPASIRIAQRSLVAIPSAVPTATTAPAARSSEPKPDLALEVRLLDDARAALGAGEPERALRVLARAEALPSRMLVPESAVLRVRALIAAGRFGDARRAGEDFLRRAPSSPQAAVVRSLLADAGAP
jgi:hypothetical protein